MGSVGNRNNQIVNTSTYTEYQVSALSRAEKFNNPEARGLNDVRTKGNLIEDKFTPHISGTYDIITGNREIKRESGYITEFNGRLYGFTETEEGYDITDIRSGRLIGKSNGKGMWSVRDTILTFNDTASKNKKAVEKAEKFFRNIKRGLNSFDRRWEF